MQFSLPLSSCNFVFGHVSFWGLARLGWFGAGIGIGGLLGIYICVPFFLWLFCGFEYFMFLPIYISIYLFTSL